MERLSKLAYVLAKLGCGEQSDWIKSLASYYRNGHPGGWLSLYPYSNYSRLYIDLSKTDEAGLKEYIISCNRINLY